MFKKAILLLGVSVTCCLLWFAVYDYREAGPIARENLRGVALSLTTAIEHLAVNDPSLKTLHAFHPPDVAYFALIDGGGVYRFHSNPDLVGTAVERGSAGNLPLFSRSETRVALGTGERAYQFASPVNVGGEPLDLVLTLHTYRADAVVRRARLNMTIVLALVGVGWLLSIGLARYAVREERHRDELARREALAKLGEMGAVLAHEIRNPLAGIKGFAQVIAARPQESRNAAFARSIVAEAVRLESLVNDLLAYATDEPQAPDHFPLAPLVEDTVALLRPDAEAHHVAVTWSCPDGLLVRGNRDRIEQALLNLLHNAVQAMEHGGELRIDAESSGAEASLSVRDNGPGIAEEHQPLVFEPFFTTKPRGTGLGLALCKKIVEANGGRISLKSGVGEGTTVTLTLPRTR
ncbi:two-component system sensor histidine kinase NtrB [Geomonas azotofigens]|uniref:two-component system sensor histidine kinase NtrB n=1 Tax=Geomonas azotofigens TaxID=2843196 RepID=UPI001C113CF3|nr:ATP-binding protein [Geomonas azotofigens]MBU5613962.1 histidine kinase [Geomonas azotofigens]